MKKLFMYVAGFMLLTAFPACSDDDSEQTNENPVSEEQLAIDDMVEALETQPNLSDFKNWLSVVDMSGVDGAQFTATERNLRLLHRRTEQATVRNSAGRKR